MSFEFERVLQTELDTALFARTFAKWLMQENPATFKIYLQGNLGAGKTTFSRYFIQGFGITGPVKSPTYTLIEPYEVGAFHILHADLYRLGSPMEIFDLGLLEEPGIWLIEWPEKGEGVLPDADVTLKLNRDVETLRMQGSAQNPAAITLLEKMIAEYDACIQERSLAETAQ